MRKKVLDLTQYVVVGCGLIPITNAYLDTIYEQDKNEDNQDELLNKNSLTIFN